MTKKNYAPMDMKKSGRWMRFVCVVKGITVREICKILGVSCPQSVYAWFNGKTMPSLDNLYGMSWLLDSPIDELVLSTEETIPKGFQERKSRQETRLTYYYYLMIA